VTKNRGQHENRSRKKGSGGCASGSKNDISGHFLFRVKEGKVEILSSSERVFSSRSLICNVLDLPEDEEAAFTIESKRLRMWLSAVADAKLTFEFEDSLVTATSPRGSVVFQSWDPEEFRYWDDTLEKAKKRAKIPAKRLSAALEYVKQFVSEKESQEPHLCNVEFQKGSVFATDKIGAVRVSVKGMKKSKLRLHGKQIPLVNKFLSFCEKVEIYEHDSASMFKSEDGTVFGESRSKHDFPELVLEEARTSGQHWWTFDKAEVLSCIQILEASADWGERDRNRMLMSLEKDGTIALSMKSSSGKVVSLSAPCTKSRSSDDAKPLPEAGFPISSLYLERVLSSARSNEVEIGIAGHGPGGWIFLEEDGKDSSRLTVLSWLL